MDLAAPFFREAGSGPSVVCLHSNASSSSQWRSLMDSLAVDHQVLAPDSLGAGKSPPWPADHAVSLSDEVALIEPVLARAQAPFALVGHSYGGAVALVAALLQPQRVSALVLYEPTLFSLLDAERAPPNEADGIRAAVAGAAAALDAGDADRAAACFIDYWMGAGAWAQTPDARKGPIAASVAHVRGWAHALLGEPTPLSAFAQLRIPALYLMGKASPASSRGVGRLLTGVLPQVEVIELDGVGHMGPITHPQLVNAAIRDFLRRH